VQEIKLLDDTGGNVIDSTDELELGAGSGTEVTLRWDIDQSDSGEVLTGILRTEDDQQSVEITVADYIDITNVEETSSSEVEVTVDFTKDDDGWETLVLGNEGGSEFDDAEDIEDIDKGNSETLTFNVGQIPEGEYTINAYIGENPDIRDSTTVTVGSSGVSGEPEFDGSISLADNEIVAGSKTTATVNIVNSGMGQGTVESVVFLFPGLTTIDTRSKTLGSDESHEYNVDVTTSEGDAGSSVSVGLGLDGVEEDYEELNIIESGGSGEEVVYQKHEAIEKEPGVVTSKAMVDSTVSSSGADLECKLKKDGSVVRSIDKDVELQQGTQEIKCEVNVPSGDGSELSTSSTDSDISTLEDDDSGEYEVVQSLSTGGATVESTAYANVLLLFSPIIINTERSPEVIELGNDWEGGTRQVDISATVLWHESYVNSLDRDIVTFFGLSYGPTVVKANFPDKNKLILLEPTYNPDVSGSFAGVDRELIAQEYEETVNLASSAGDKINYEIQAEYNDLLNPSVSPTVEERIRSFRTVEDVAVVFAEFAQESNDDRKPIYRGEELAEIQQDYQQEINEYMSGWRGSYGGVGYDFEYLPGDGEWYTVREFSEYENYPTDNENTLDNDRLSQYIQDARGKLIDNGADTSEFDTFVHVSPGLEKRFRSSTSRERFFNINPFHDRDSSGNSVLYLNEGADLYDTDSDDPVLSTFIHELGHSLGHYDLYIVQSSLQSALPIIRNKVFGGQVGYQGMMGDGADTSDALAPFSAVSKTRIHKLSPEEGNRDEWPWLGVNREDRIPDSNSINTFEIETLDSKEYGDGFEQEEEGVKVSKSEVRPGRYEYVFSARDNEGISGSSYREEGVYIYWIDKDPRISDETDGNLDLVTLLQAGQVDVDPPDISNVREEKIEQPTLENRDGRDTLEITPSNHHVSFKLDQEPTEDRNAVLRVGRPLSATQQSVGSITSYDFPGNVSTESTSPPVTNTTPDIRLRAVDNQGKIVGVDYDKGEYVIEIPGVDPNKTSGNQLNFEWITVPGNTSVVYEADTRGIENWLEEVRNITDESGGDISDIDNTTNATIQLDTYSKETEINETTGELENYVTMEKRVSLEPNETTSVGASTKTDFDPDTLNKQSSGRWVNVTLEIPQEEIDVENMNVSTVTLNEEVQAEDNDRFGFVRNPVEDGVFEAKFPRDEVAETLETGKNITIFVTAETEAGEIITGQDEVRVIKRPRGYVCPPGQGNPGQGSPDEVPGQGPPEDNPGQGPPDEVPGQGPPDCSPNNDTDEPENGNENNDTADSGSEEEPDEDEQARRNRGRGDEPAGETRRDSGRSDSVPGETTRDISRGGDGRSGNSRGTGGR